MDRNPDVRADANETGDPQVAYQGHRGGVGYGVRDLTGRHEPAVGLRHRYRIVRLQTEGGGVARQAPVDLLAVGELRQESEVHVQVPASQMQDSMQATARQGTVDLRRHVGPPE
jgi:hypothetical protein